MVSYILHNYKTKKAWYKTRDIETRTLLLAKILEETSFNYL